MSQQDTVSLLRECDAGVKMGIASLDEVLDTIRSPRLKERLIRGKEEHESLRREIADALKQLREPGKEPNAAAVSMSWIKTNVKIAVDRSDATVADLMIGGCDMGVKSLSRYLNQYPAAEGFARSLARRLIAAEETLSRDLREYL